MKTNDVIAYDPADRLFGANAPTASKQLKETKASLGKRIGIFLIAVSLLAFVIVGLVQAHADADSRYVSACDATTGVRTSADIPNSFPGGIKAWEASGGKVIHTPC